MAEENKEVDVQIRLISAEEVKCEIHPTRVPDNASADLMRCSFSNQIATNVDTNRITLRFGARIHYKEHMALECIYHFTFNVTSLGRFVIAHTDGSIQVDYIMPQLLDVAVGTMRGILIAKSEGTNLAKFPLPLVDVQELSQGLSVRKS